MPSPHNTKIVCLFFLRIFPISTQDALLLEEEESLLFSDCSGSICCPTSSAACEYHQRLHVLQWGSLRILTESRQLQHAEKREESLTPHVQWPYDSPGVELSDLLQLPELTPCVETCPTVRRRRHRGFPSAPCFSQQSVFHFAQNHSDGDRCRKETMLDCIRWMESPRTSPPLLLLEPLSKDSI